MAEIVTIGVTGGIGSGKSVVSRVLRCNGFQVYDCDLEAKKIMENDVFVRKGLENIIGQEAFLRNGKLNKKKISQEIYSDVSKREKVNSLVHEAVRKDIEKHRHENKGIFFIESAILYTGGINRICDKIWVVSSPLKERIKRVEERDKLSQEEVLKRIQSQENEIPLSEKEMLIYIENDENHQLLTKVLTLTNKYIENQNFEISC